MDNRSHSPGGDDNGTSEHDHEHADIVPAPQDEPQPPPVDVDEREGHDHDAAPIEMPGQEAQDEAIADEVDSHMPLPTDEPYHDDDSAEPDPYDVDDAMDLHLPRPTGDAADEVDDFSTDEEIDVDTAPERGPREAIAMDDDRVRLSSSTEAGGPEIYVGGPSDDDPADDESNIPGVSSDMDADIGPADHSAEPMPAPPPLDASGTTTCPVCGRETDALRFCGYCGTQLTEDRREPQATTLVGRLQERGGRLLDPIARWTRPGMVRFIMAMGGLLVLTALLANNGGLALVIGSAILPLILIYWCLESDIFDHEPPLVIAGFGLAGTIVGAVLGWLGSIIVANSWFDTGILNYGAAGYGGRFAEIAGTAPFLVWALVGIVFPVLALIAIIGLPLAMRQTFSLHNEVMDGLTIGAVMGAGYAFGTAIVFAAPMLGGGGPASDASAWTLTTIGITVIRPLVWTLSAGMLGAATWRYLLSGSIGSAIIPAAVGIAAPLLFTLVSIQLAPSGLWAEVLWGALIAVVAGVLYWRTMHQAILQDRQILGTDDARMVCPNCHRVTPTGRFCAHCGEDLALETA